MNLGDHNENDYKVLEELADPEDPDKQFQTISRPTPSELFGRVEQIESEKTTLKGLLVKAKRALEPTNLKYKLDGVRLEMSQNIDSTRARIDNSKVKKSIDGITEKAKNMFIKFDSEQFRNNIHRKMTTALKLDKVKEFFDSLTPSDKNQTGQPPEGYDEATIETTTLQPRNNDNYAELDESNKPLFDNGEIKEDLANAHNLN